MLRGGRPVALLAVGGAGEGHAAAGGPHTTAPSLGNSPGRDFLKPRGVQGGGLARRPGGGFPFLSESSHRSAHTPECTPSPGAGRAVFYLGAGRLSRSWDQNTERRGFSCQIEGGPTAPRVSGPGALEVPWLPGASQPSDGVWRLHPGLYPVSQDGSARSPDPDSAPSPGVPASSAARGGACDCQLHSPIESVPVGSLWS